jgi:hypothetical protein
MQKSNVMNLKKYIILSLVLLQPLLVISGQKFFKPGYIVTNKNDTIRGLVSLQTKSDYSKMCSYMDSEKKEKKIYTPEEISSYRIENKMLFQSKEIEINKVKTRVFLEYLVNGIADLYYLYQPDGDVYFITKDTVLIPLTNRPKSVTVNEDVIGMRPDIKTYEGESNQYKGVLRYLFQDSPEVVKEIEGTAFNHKSLIKITKNYHNSIAKDKKCIDYTK